MQNNSQKIQNTKLFSCFLATWNQHFFNFSTRSLLTKSGLKFERSKRKKNNYDKKSIIMKNNDEK